MAYRLEYEPGVLRSLGRLAKHVQRRILARLETLRDNPRPPGSIKLTGENAYGIRVGDYRVIYTIFDDRLLVLVIDIGHRRDVHRRR
jgi:mRNA interferase RelE/StbE